HGYAFHYDPSDRLLKGEYSGWSPQFYGLLGLNWTGNAGRYAIPDGIGYDMNGNIQTMKRNGVEDVQSNVVVWGAMDEMTYHYNGNRLESIEDNVAYTGGVFEQFRKQTPYTGNPEYLYDPNGNIVQDVNKGITISYNHLNKPTMIDFGNGHTLQYTYAADGRKLRERTKVSGQPDVKADYPLAGLYYRDNQLVYISTAEGRALQTASSIDPQSGKVQKTFRYEYYLKDHLGNIRFLFTDTDTDGVPEILQEDAYDPWGIRLAGLSYTQGEKNRYLYNGKEQVKGLGWYDYGARMYDPATGRWNGVDMLAEKYIGISPYVYCADNPVLFLDVDGRFGIPAELLAKYPNLNRALEDVKKQLETNIEKLDLLQRLGEYKNHEEILNQFSPDAGPTLLEKNLLSFNTETNNLEGDNAHTTIIRNAETLIGEAPFRFSGGKIELDDGVFDLVNKVYDDKNHDFGEETKGFIKLLFQSTMEHELVHNGDLQPDGVSGNKMTKDESTSDKMYPKEPGIFYEEVIYGRNVSIPENNDIMMYYKSNQTK
ncbi:MAG: RHS repeat-associated core domain-containing protein, partial [Bacteroidia bacterium]|nr:RHS repeat-associated core domain-containing protein [Bacteroidia bacterium]